MVKIIRVESCENCLHLDLEDCQTCSHEKGADLDCGEYYVGCEVHPDCPLEDAYDLISRKDVVGVLEGMREKPHNLWNSYNEGCEDTVCKILDKIQSMPGGCTENV